MLSMILKLYKIKHEFDQIDYSLIMEKNHLKKKDIVQSDFYEIIHELLFIVLKKVILS